LGVCRYQRFQHGQKAGCVFADNRAKAIQEAGRTPVSAQALTHFGCALALQQRRRLSDLGLTGLRQRRQHIPGWQGCGFEIIRVLRVNAPSMKCPKRLLDSPATPRAVSAFPPPLPIVHWSSSIFRNTLMVHPFPKILQIDIGFTAALTNVS